MKTYTESLSCWKKKWYTWTVLLRLVFLDNEYSSEVFQTLLAVFHFSNVAWESQKQSSRGVLQKRCIWKFRKPKVFSCGFSEIFKYTFFHRTPPVAASEKLKAKAVVRTVFCKKGVLRNFAKFTGKYLCQSLFFTASDTDLFLWILRALF